MMAKALLVRLFFLLTSLRGVCPVGFQEISVRAGEMVALQCPHDKHADAKFSWTSNTTQEMDLTDMLSPKQRQMGVVIHEGSLVILNASVNHQGNYLCSLGNASKGFQLKVHTTQTDNEERTPQICYTQESCTLKCPDVDIPALNTLNITSNDIIWHKDGESLRKNNYFQSVEENDHGVYTCTRSYMYHSQIYKKTCTVSLQVQPKPKSNKSAMITEPRMGDVIYVDLGSPQVIDCKADLYSELDEVFWLSGDSPVDEDSNLPVFYNYTKEDVNGKTIMAVSLVFKKVSKEDLQNNYTCKLESVTQLPGFVTIILAQKLSYAPLVLGTVCTVVVMVFTVVICVKFKINITLFLRDTLGCHSSTSDHKSYDAFLMCYESNKDAGLNEDDKKWLESVLEERFGYSLCLYDRDVLPGQDVAEVVLDCIEQSRTVVLVPTSPDPGPGSGLLSAIHEALVERQTRLVFIKTEATEGSRSGSLPEALQLLAKAAACVTWKGMSSIPPSSSFWKQLRYYLPAPQRASRTRLLPI